MTHDDRRALHRPATLCVHGGRRPSADDPALVAPTVRSSTFLQHPGTHVQTDAGKWDEALVYSRYGNPTTGACESRLAALEGCDRSLVFGSGMAAMHAALLSLARPGSTIYVARELYGGTQGLVDDLASIAGFGVRRFGVADGLELEDALGDGAGVVVCESMSNPTLVVADIPRIAAAVHAAGATLLVDATFASPVLQRPLELGADLVMHSATKYLGGHSDLIAGVVSGSGPVMDRVRLWRKRAGGIADPQTAFLLDRGVKTLALRMRAHCAGADHLADALAGHPRVVKVHHPSRPDHPTHALGRELLSGGGGVLSFEIDGGDAMLRPFVARLELAYDAPSLGSVETLVSLPVHMSHAGLAPDELRAAGIAPGLVRVSVGIEDPEDLTRDFLGALDSTA